MHTNNWSLFRVHSCLFRGYEHKPVLAQRKHGSVLSIRYGRSQADPLLSIRGYLWCGQFEDL
jgi:hypothetical protein